MSIDNDINMKYLNLLETTGSFLFLLGFSDASSAARICSRPLHLLCIQQLKIRYDYSDSQRNSMSVSNNKGET
jgi:hypothetical protein